jgi:hypothetical protein
MEKKRMNRGLEDWYLRLILPPVGKLFYSCSGIDWGSGRSLYKPTERIPHHWPSRFTSPLGRLTMKAFQAGRPSRDTVVGRKLELCSKFWLRR